MTALASAALPSGAVETPAGRELKELQGEWTMVRHIVNGEPVKPQKGKVPTITFAGDQLVGSNNPKDTKTIVIDPTGKPATIDLKDTYDETVLGIYKLSGDSLTICIGNEMEIPRPKEFESPKGRNIELIELKRSKK